MANRKQVVILAANAGFGHRCAAKTVAAARQETYGDGCVVEIANPLDGARMPAWLRRSQAPLQAVYTLSRRHIPTPPVVTDLCLVPAEHMRNLAKNAVSPHAKPRSRAFRCAKIAQQHADRNALRAELGSRTDLPTVLAVGRLGQGRDDLSTA